MGNLLCVCVLLALLETSNFPCCFLYGECYWILKLHLWMEIMPLYLDLVLNISSFQMYDLGTYKVLKSLFGVLRDPLKILCNKRLMFTILL